MDEQTSAQALEEMGNLVRCIGGETECPRCNNRRLMISGWVEFYNGRKPRRFESDIIAVDPEYGPQFEIGVKGDTSGTCDEVLSCDCGWNASLLEVEFQHEERGR